MMQLGPYFKKLMSFLESARLNQLQKTTLIVTRSLKIYQS